MQQQRQQYADFDLLAVFSDETKATAAESKLHKEGFTSEEVMRLASDTVVNGQFREHGPDRNRSSVFLQTTRPGSNPVKVVVFAVIFGLILGTLLLAAHFAFTAIPELAGTLAGVVVGIILGALVGLLQRGPLRGAIGQDMTKVNMVSKKPAQADMTVIAIHLPDAADLARKSRARAILLTNGGKIDRSVGGNE